MVDGVMFPSPAASFGLLAAVLFAFLGWFYFRAREATRMFSQVSIGDARATVKVRARALFGQFVIYCLALLGALILLSAAGGMLFAGFLSSLFTGAGGGTGSGSVATDIAQMMQGSWITVAVLILGYLIIIATFALFGEVFLGYGYWMLVARGATISNADSLLTVRGHRRGSGAGGRGPRRCPQRRGVLMELAARYHDGLVSLVRDVICRVEAQSLVITDLATRSELDRWNAADVFPLHARKHELARRRHRQALRRAPHLQRLRADQGRACHAAGARSQASC